MDTDKPLAVQVWDELKVLIQKETSPYLSLDKFVLQKDAFVRLSDEDVAEDVPFVTYDYAEVTSDEALGFGMAMLRDGVFFEIGPTTYGGAYKTFAHDSQASTLNDKEYDALEDNPKKAAQNILLIIKLLLSGQMAVGVTWRNGRFLAAESFLLGFITKPTPISIVGNFGPLARTGLDYVAYQNKVLDEQFKISKDFPLLPPIINSKRVKPGRDVDSIHGLEPLTKKQFDELDVTSEMHQFAGMDNGKNIWAYFYKTLEFWLTTFAVLGVFAFLHFSSLAPKFFHQIPVGLYAVVSGWFVIPFFTGLLLAFRQQKINQGERPLSYKIQLAIESLFSKGKKKSAKPHEGKK